VSTLADTDVVRQLNHVEMVYRPGERQLAGRVFELLGLRVIDPGDRWLFALVDPAFADFSNNACYASEVTPEQWALEQALESAIGSDTDTRAAGGAPARAGDVGPTARAYLGRLRVEPQRSFHLGIRIFGREDFDATLDRIRAAAIDPELAGRVTLSGVFHPDEPGALARNMIQAFVRTDVVAAGLLAFGQHIELQFRVHPGGPDQR
jgi:hypothetical protein